MSEKLPWPRRPTVDDMNRLLKAHPKLSEEERSLTVGGNGRGTFATAVGAGGSGGNGGGGSGGTWPPNDGKANGAASQDLEASVREEAMKSFRPEREVGPPEEREPEEREPEEPLRSVIEARHASHGDMRDVAWIQTQLLKVAMAAQPRVIEGVNKNDDSFWDAKPAVVRLALQEMFHKVARVLAGDELFEDHWKDMAGYPTRVLDFIREGEIR